MQSAMQRLSRLAWVCCALAAGCGGSSTPDSGAPSRDAAAIGDGGRRDGGGETDGGDGGRIDGGASSVTLVDVAHERELRGVWVATVFNINWPSRTGLSAAQMQAEMESLLDHAKDAGMNAVFFQVRAESDAFYASSLEPWSRFLTGTMGEDPGYDPLQHAIEQAHARGLELHAWVNPYRALASASPTIADPLHVTRSHAEWTVTYGANRWYDPGNAEARTHTLAVLRDILTRYDVDGLHFDDYFYPYPESGVTFGDAATYAAYQSGGGTLSIGDWRRENVHTMVSAVDALVREVRDDVRFGISPFGIYRPGMPPGISGLDQYAAIYSDPMRWLSEGWLDYLAPQLYWPTTRAAQDYAVLLGFWADAASAANTDLYVGNYLSQLGSASDWSVDEFRTEVALTRAARDRRALGNIQYQIAPIVENRSGIADVFEGELYARPAASPPIPRATARPAPPRVSVDGADVTLASDDELRFYAAYRMDDASAFALERLVVAADASATLYRGEWAISAIDRSSMESQGVRVTIEVGDPPGPPPPPTGRSCTHSFGGIYSDRGCSPSYQCCDGTWVDRAVGCGACVCEEATGMVGCSP
ncbi:MAG: glycoside hydrolase family 10 protein [Sandaracinaceae bacterium]